MDIKFELQTKRLHKTDIIVGVDVYLKCVQQIALNNDKQCYVIIDENVYKLHPDKIDLIQKLFDQVIIGIVPAGERSKSIKEFEKLVDLGLQSGVKRNTPLFAIGGGVTGDLAGFVASSLLRGLPLYHIPTTLLAMVDSSIGGKTGINHVVGKNLIGAFYQPEQVVMDVSFLDTLPDKELNCGLGEVLKYGCISEYNLLDLTEEVIRSKDPNKMLDLVKQCAKIKAEIVEKDELESGIRAYLNFGHTFAHALESHTNYARFAHGEAVYVGLLAALHFSSKVNPDIDSSRLLRFVNTFKLQTNDLIKHVDDLIKAMYKDKKMTSDSLMLVVLNDWERPVLRETNEIDLVKNSWIHALENAHYTG
jgi:3-dehydroquinate synthase